MKVIPSQVFLDDSKAEKDIHRLLSDIRLSDYDLSLHSLNIGKHDYKRWAEGDFIVLSELGILLLEIKGGRLKCNDSGIWTHTDRYGRSNKKKESPGQQAKSAFFSLKKNFLDKKFEHALEGVPCGFACVLRDLDRVVSLNESALNEMPDTITAYRRHCKSPDAFKNWLRSVFAVYRNKINRPKQLSKTVIDDIKGFLRPTFDKQPPLGHQVSEFDDVLHTLTTNQYKVIAGIEANDRVLIQGGAGTGKTFCAMASARSHASSSQSVLFVTRSPYLAAYLKATQKLPENLNIKYLDELAYSEQQKEYDVLVVDEGQDLCQLDTIDRLSNILKNKMDGGIWRWFWDKDHQISPSYKFDADAYEFLNSLGAFKLALQENVRNTPEIIDHIQIFSNVKMEENPVNRGGFFYFETADDSNSEMEILKRYLKKWIKTEELPLYEVCLITFDLRQSEKLLKKMDEWNYRAELLDTKTMASERKSIMISTAEDFKGLERSVICVMGTPMHLDKKELKKFFYKAFSRARHTLLVVSSDNKELVLKKIRQEE